MQCLTQILNKILSHPLLFIQHQPLFADIVENEFDVIFFFEPEDRLGERYLNHGTNIDDRRWTIDDRICILFFKFQFKSSTMAFIFENLLVWKIPWTLAKKPTCWLTHFHPKTNQTPNRKDF